MRENKSEKIKGRDYRDRPQINQEEPSVPIG